MSHEKGRALPKFGEWDANNPASAEGFTVIFNKARDERKTSSAANAPRAISPEREDQDTSNLRHESYANKPGPVKKWFCCMHI